MGKVRLAVLMGTAMLASPLAAEKLHVSGFYPARSDAAAALRSIAVEPFGGEFGSDLAINVEDTLRGANLDGRPWFRVVPSGMGGGTDAVMRGSASAEQQVSGYTEDRERCVKDDSGKCTSVKETYKVNCKRRHVELIVHLRLIASNGQLIWSDDSPASNDDSWCEDAKSPSRSFGAVARGLTQRVAGRLTIQFVPYAFAEDVRVDEDRKGLSKPDADRFKAAVAKVKRNDIAGACADWQGLLGANPAHVPTIYNLGLCAESAGDEAAAAGFYRQAQSLDQGHDKTRAGFDRIAAHERARRQIAAHGAG